MAVVIRFVVNGFIQTISATMTVCDFGGKTTSARLDDDHMRRRMIPLLIVAGRLTAAPVIAAVSVFQSTPLVAAAL